MRSDFVVVTSPTREFASGICQTRDPVLVETYVPEAAVEALTQLANSGVLCRSAGFNQHVFDLVRLRLVEKGSAVNSGPFSVRMALG